MHSFRHRLPLSLVPMLNCVFGRYKHMTRNVQCSWHVQTSPTSRCMTVMRCAVKRWLPTPIISWLFVLYVRLVRGDFACVQVNLPWTPESSSSSYQLLDSCHSCAFKRKRTFEQEKAEEHSGSFVEEATSVQFTHCWLVLHLQA